MAKKRPPPTATKGSKPRPKGGRAPFRPDLLAAALLALALAVRLWGIGDRLPDPTLGINVLDDSAVEETDRTTMGRAWQMWSGGTKPLDLNPHTGGWPGLSFYVGLGTQMTYKTYFVAKHPGATPEQFVDHVSKGSNEMFLYGRALGALIGVLTVFLTFQLVKHLGGRMVGLATGLLVALNPLHIFTSQHIADPNLLALLFVLLAAAAMTRVAEGGSARDSVLAGAMIGLAGACKYVPLVLVVPLAFAHGRGFLKNRAFFLALAAVGIAMFAGSPFTFLDWKTTVLDMTTQKRALFSDWVGQTSFPFSLPAYLAVSLPHVMGWPAYILSLVGMWVAWRKLPLARPALLIPAVMVLANGALKAAQERYMLVAIPILFFGTVMALLAAVDWLKARGPDAARAAVAAPALLGALALAWPLPEYFTQRHDLGLPDTRHLSRAWINANIPADKPMAVELYGPIFQPDERTMLIWPFFATQVPLVRCAYHPEFLDGLEYYVQSGEVSRRFDADSVSYPVESSYYRWIRANTTVVWKAPEKNSSGPMIEVRRVPAIISTMAGRDSLFERLMPTPTTVSRVALWCYDYATVFGRLGDFDRAIEWANRGLKVNAPRLNPKLHSVLAYSFLNLQIFDAAEIAAKAGVAEAPKDLNLRLYHAMALQQLGNVTGALDEYTQAYQMSADPRILLNVGAGLSALGRYEDAVAALGRVPVGHPDRGTARQDMAVILLNNLRRPEEGLAALHEAASLTRDPHQAKLLTDEIGRIEAMKRKATGR
ncbi:MAG: glycosyltransferase family 39 protein [Candidatus Eiseniibacteriota bacterium]